MLSPSSMLTLNPAVVSTTLESGDAVLMHIETAKYFTLNSTGVRIWQLFEQTPSIQQVIDRVLDEYEVTPEQAQSSVLTLAQHFIDAELVAVNAETGHD
ncbi:MAG: PqqD family protein [Caldilineaceae bacterium]